MIAGLTLARLRRRSPERRPRPAAARQLTVALLPVLALAACSGGTSLAAGSGSPPPTSQSPVVVTIAAATDVVTTDAAPQFRISANPAPRADLAVTVTITALGCVLAQSSASVPIAAGESHATLTVPTGGVAAGANGCVVTATIAAGEGYAVGAAAGASASVTLTMQPVVTVTADSATVTEGSPVSFTLTAAPPPAGDLAVTVSWSGSGSFLAATSPRTVTIAASAQTAPLTAATVDDSDPEADGSVTVTLEAGSGYTVGASGSATVDVTDNDTTGTASPGPTAPGSGVVPQVTIARLDTAVTEGKPVRFKLTATPAPASALTVNVQWKDPGGYLSGTPPQTATIPPSGTSELAADTDDDTEAAADRFVRVTVMAGSGYVAGASARIRVEDNDTPRVTVTALNYEDYDHDTITLPPVYEGGTIAFTLTANPKPASALTVALAWHLAGDISPPTTPYRVRLPTTGTASVSMAAGDDDKDNAYDTRVGVHLQSGAGYRLGAPNRAYVWIVNND